MYSDMVPEDSEVRLGLTATSFFPSAYTLQSIVVGEHGRLLESLTKSKQGLSR